MLKLNVPRGQTYCLQNLVLDYNGTLAIDGKPIRGTLHKLHRLSTLLQIYVLTADTFGIVQKYINHTDFHLHVLRKGNHDEQKALFVKQIGASSTLTIGNGLNDHKMLKEAVIGIAVIQKEGASVKSISCADLVFTDINDALNALLKPKRLIASLRR